MKHKNPSRWQREMVVMGWQLVPRASVNGPNAAGMVYASPDGRGTWIVQNAEGEAPTLASETVTAVLYDGAKVVETRTGRAGRLCPKLNPSFRVGRVA